MLPDVASFRIVTLSQLARVLGLSPKATRRHVRALFDAGLLDLMTVPRDALGASDQTPGSESTTLPLRTVDRAERSAKSGHPLKSP
jgi:hypothetical protein